MYIASVLIGIGAAVLWAAQAEFLHLQSPTDQIMMRNTGIFWCLFQVRNVSALLFGRSAPPKMFADTLEVSPSEIYTFISDGVERMMYPEQK